MGSSSRAVMRASKAAAMGDMPGRAAAPASESELPPSDMLRSRSGSWTDALRLPEAFGPGALTAGARTTEPVLEEDWRAGGLAEGEAGPDEAGETAPEEGADESSAPGATKESDETDALLPDLPKERPKVGFLRTCTCNAAVVRRASHAQQGGRASERNKKKKNKNNKGGKKTWEGRRRIPARSRSLLVWARAMPMPRYSCADPTTSRVSSL